MPAPGTALGCRQRSSRDRDEKAESAEAGANHQVLAMTSHLGGGEPRRVANPRTADRRARAIKEMS
jgi:hypothetical protein